MRASKIIFALLALLLAPAPARGESRVEITGANLSLGISLEGGCRIDSLRVGGREVLDPRRGIATGGVVRTRTGLTTLTLQGTPQIERQGGRTIICGIRLAGGGAELRETWYFNPAPDAILWSIERDNVTSCSFSELATPSLFLKTPETYDAALLDNGGSAWFKMLDTTPSALGQHASQATFWKRGEPWCLSVQVGSPGGQVAMRFARGTDGAISQSVYAGPCEPVFKYLGNIHKTRFIRKRTDVWAPVSLPAGRQTITVRLAARKADELYGRGRLSFVAPDVLTTIANTIARVGVIDRGLMGGNNYHTGYVCLHEQYIADLGLFIDDPQYFAAYQTTLDNYRDHAVEADGRVKSRFAPFAGDATPGTYDANGFYECQWGWLMDSQPDFVINVCSLFDFNGDRAWLATHKATCEKALDYLLARDGDSDGLVEMKNKTRLEQVSSDWIDIVWAAHENAFVNAEMYHALRLWSRCERLLGDPAKAGAYAARAAKLRQRFNQSTAEGGFWSPDKQCYVYWREPDGSIHGDNMVTPVNFMAIAYGICEYPARIAAILDGIEQKTAAEKLFFWPLCLTSFQYDEVSHRGTTMWPFPGYENGDLFLSWGGVGVESCARTRPELALKYVRQVIAQYEKDGLAFQRYLRRDQRGAGDDILSGNALIFVGLYRAILGIQPRHNRLDLDPYPTPEVAGSAVRYRLRGREFTITYERDQWTAACGRASVTGRQAFGLWVADDGTLDFFAGEGDDAAARLKPARAGGALKLTIEEWSAHRRAGTITAPQGATLELLGLPSGADFTLTLNGQATQKKIEGDGTLAIPLGATQNPTSFQLDF